MNRFRTVTRSILGSVVLAGWIGTAQAIPTAQQSCNYARMTAWRVYQTCVDTAVAKEAKGIVFDQFAVFAKCRHTYFKKWAAFQLKSSWVGTTCRGPRYTDLLVGEEVQDNLSGLIWEKKRPVGSGGPNDVGNVYTWNAFSSYNFGNGTVYSSFLTAPRVGPVGGLNVTAFGETSDWRLPTFAELQSIELDFPCAGVGGGPQCSCPSSPCIDPALDPVNTQSDGYWSATTYVPDPTFVWFVYFGNGGPGIFLKTSSQYARGVRGSL